MHLRLPCSQLNHVPKHHLTGTALPTPNHSFHEEILPDSNFPDATWAHFLMPNHLSLEKDRLIPAATFFQVLLESDEVSSQPPPLPTKQSQFSHISCFLVPSAALFLFSANPQEIQYPPCTDCWMPYNWTHPINLVYTDCPAEPLYPQID